MQILYLFEKIRVPVLNEFMLLITELGDETAFLVISMIVFWCVDKKRGYFVMTVGFLGTMLNQFLKLTFRVPRPWVKDPSFTILEQAREAATGFSFPSGHATSAVGTFGSVALTADRRWVRNLCIAICILVPVSRMYVGVHTFWDVIVGAVLALCLVKILSPLCWKTSDRAFKDILSLLLGLAVTLLLYTKFFPFSIAQDQLHNLESGAKNAYTMVGAISGLMVVYPLERKYVNFETKAIWWAQILKVVLGLGLVLVVKEGLRAPLEMLFSGHMVARAIRYHAIVLVAGLIWPMTFKWFSKLGAKNELRGN